MADWDDDQPAPAPTHVSKKRHRFQRVNERVAHLQTELQLHVKTNASEISLTFQEELGLQGELTMVESFQVLYRKLQPLVTTTPQLLHNLKKIVKLLRAELQAEPVADIQRDRMVPVLKLITALARELRKEFYPHFAGMLPPIIAVIDTKDPELSTQVFKTITMLFNFLRVQLLKDMDAVHKCYFPLLGHPKPFVRDFAAQTLSVLLRRIDQPKELRKYLSTYLRALARGAGRDDEMLRDGSAKLFFALLKNVNHGFHSRMSEIFVALLGAFRPKTEEGDDDERALMYDIVGRTSELMVRHTDATHAHELLECFSLVLTKMVTKGERNAACDTYLCRVSTMFLTLIKHKSGKLVAHNPKNLGCLHTLCRALLEPEWMLLSTTEELRSVLLRVFETVWRLFAPAEDVVQWQIGKFFSAAVTAPSDDVAVFWRTELLALIDRQLQHTHVTVEFVRAFVFPHALSLVFDTLLPSNDLSGVAVLLGRLGDYLAAHEEVADGNASVIDREGHRFLTFHDQLKRESLLAAADACLEASLANADDTERIQLAWKTCRALALVDLPETKRRDFAAPFLKRVDLLTMKDPTAVAWRALRAELWRLLQIATSQMHHQPSPAKTKKAKAPEPFVWQALEQNESSYATLSAFLEYLKMQTQDKHHELLPVSCLEDAETRFAENLRSPSRAIRLVTLEILSRFERISYHESDDEAATLEGPCELLDHALQAEQLCASVDVSVEREIVRHINRVKILGRSKQTPVLYKKMAINHLFGLYHVKFSTLWSHVAEAIAAIVHVEFEATWPSVRDVIWFTAFRAEVPVTTTTTSDSQGNANGSLATLPKDTVVAIRREFEGVCRLERGELDLSVVTDTLTHHNLVWKGLEKIVEPLEKKTKFFVPVFLLFLRDQYTVIYKDELEGAKLTELTAALDKAQATTEMGSWIGDRYAPLPAAAVTTKAVRQRLVDYLRLFAVFKNMKGAYANSFLHEFFFDLLMKSDEHISKLALQCLYGFGKKHLTAYKDQLNRLADPTTFREELTTFHIAPEAGIVLQEHRAALLPVLMRLLYSKAVSKKGRNTGDTVGARRAAILSYLAALPPSELAYFVELVVRAFDVPLDLSPSSSGSVTDVAVGAVQPSRILGFLNLLEDLIDQLGVHLAAFVPALASIVLAILQFNIQERDEELRQQQRAANADGMDDDVEMADADAGDVAMDHEDEDEGGPQDAKAAGMRKQIRTLAYRRLAEMISAFDDRVDLTPWVTTALSASDDAILHLPGALVGATKASALLEFVVAVAGGARARTAMPATQITSVIKCLASGLTPTTTSEQRPRGLAPEVLTSVLQFLGALLDGDEAPEATSASWRLIPHIPLILAQFVTRFQSKAARYAQERYAGSSKRELVLLCRIAQHLVASPALAASAGQSALDLFQLLLPFLQRNHHSSAADMENILEVLARLVNLLADPKRHVGALAKLLAPGPNGLTDRGVRAKLVEVFAAIGAHPSASDVPAMARMAALLADLNAFDAKKLEEVDFERRIDALSAINQGEFAEFTAATWLLAPILAQYLQCMHETEYSLRSTALVGLTQFVRLTAGTVAAEGPSSATAVVLLNVLESLVMPCVRASVKAPSEDTRRGFVLLLAALADHPALHGLPYVPGDLALLRRADDVEVDFFYNLTHIQVHRKRRALQRLTTLMTQMAEAKRQQDDGELQEQQQQQPQKRSDENNDGDDDDNDDDDDDDVPMAEPLQPSGSGTAWFSNSTVNHLLVPLVMHFIYEAQAKSQESLRHEAAQCIGSAAGLLGWSHYLALLRRLLKSIEGHAEMEAAIIATICAVIDHHHFTNAATAEHMQSWTDVKKLSAETRRKDTSKTAETEGNVEMVGDAVVSFKVEDQLEVQVLPMLKKYLFKAVTAKGASRITSTTSFDDSIVSAQHVTVRVPLALAIVKVLRRLRPAAFFLEFPKLLVSFTKLLKSKQEEVRSSARVTLVKIVEELGAAYLLPVVEELRHTLQDGYMLHVLAYTVNVILDKVSKLVQPRKPPSLLSSGANSAAVVSEDAYNSDLDACLPSILAIIVEDLFRGVVENQDGTEYKSKMKEAKSTSKSFDALELLARSITFLPNPAIHTLISAIVTKFREQPENAKSIHVLQEALRRIALGLVKNSGVERSHVFLYAYNILQSCLEEIRPMSETEKAKYEAVAKGSRFLVDAWQINEKSAKAAAQLAKRVKPLDTARVQLQSKMTGFNRHEIDNAERQNSRTHLDELLTYSVYVLFAFVRAGATKGKTDDAEDHQDEIDAGAVESALIDPLVPLLMRCAAESKNNRAVINALKCLSVLLNSTPAASTSAGGSKTSAPSSALPSLDVALSPLVDRLFKILQKAGAATRNEMVQTCYRTLTVILRHRPAFRLTEAQLRVLVSFVRADLDETEHQNATYALLKSILASRLVIPEIYDVVVVIGEILVRSLTQSARANCASIYITFLLEYPLGPKRLTQHLHFLIKNLAYEYESGRRAVLETLGALLKRLPLEVINDKAQFFLLPLVLRVANDDAVGCRELAREAIKTLIRRMGNQALNECVALVAQWWATATADRKLVATAAQVTALVLDTRPEFIDKHAIAVLTSARGVLQRGLEEMAEADDSATLDWRLMGHVLRCLERFSECLIARYESWLVDTPVFVDEELGALLEYPHASVRRAALGLWGSYLGRRSPQTLGLRKDAKIKKLTPALAEAAAKYLAQPGTLFTWASRVIKLVERPEVASPSGAGSREADEDERAMATETVIVLSQLCSALVANPSIPQDVRGDAIVSSEEVEQSEETVEVDTATQSHSDEDDEEEHGDDDDQAAEAAALAQEAQSRDQDERRQSRTPLGWILTRLSYVARGASEATQTTIFQFFAAFIHEHDAAVVGQYLVQLINPLYRATSTIRDQAAAAKASKALLGTVGKADGAEPPASALLAQEVLERLEQKVGVETFLGVYTFVQKRLAVFRASRREQRKRQLIHDPALAARRKLAKNDQKRRAKQLRKRKFAVLKGTASAATRPQKAPRPGHA